MCIGCDDGVDGANGQGKAGSAAVGSGVTVVGGLAILKWRVYKAFRFNNMFEGMNNSSTEMDGFEKMGQFAMLEKCGCSSAYSLEAKGFSLFPVKVFFGLGSHSSFRLLIQKVHAQAFASSGPP